MLWDILINTMIFRNDFINNTRMHIEKLNRFFIIYLTLVSATGLLFQCQIPLAIAQSVNDQNLNVETFVEGLNLPTSMAFLDSNNIWF